MGSPQTFKCDACGREFPRGRLKEVFVNSHRQRLCPEDLDKKMNESNEVKGGPGEEKVAAAYVDEAADRAPYGKREG